MEHRHMRSVHARELIEKLMATERLRASSHFSDRVFRDEPILTTGRQMANYLPDRYREMRAISRWQDGTRGGRWLTEAELFWKQASFMADWEDDCPYNGSFKSYYPTYNAMSDRQLRGYFTWRAAVRRGEIAPTSTSFAYVYLYELIGGIGASSSIDGFERFKAFWEAYRLLDGDIDRHAGLWLQDYVVYHGLDRELLADAPARAHDRALNALARADAACRALAPAKLKAGASILPLPPRTDLEEQLFGALDELSSYRAGRSRLYREDPEALRRVTCAVWTHLSRRRERQSDSSLIDSWFGSRLKMPYTMFASAVFFEPERHPDTVYELDEGHRYECASGLWSCERRYGTQARSPKLGQMMRACDRTLRCALDIPYPLKDDGKIPRYLQQAIDREVAAFLDWRRAHAPVRIEIDRTRLDAIRHTAAQTREALLIEEERSGCGELVQAANPSAGPHDARERGASDSSPAASSEAASADRRSMVHSGRPADLPPQPASTAGGSPPDFPAGAKAPDEAAPERTVPEQQARAATEYAAPDGGASVTSTEAAREAEATGGLDATGERYLHALAANDRAAARAAAEAEAHSEDLLVDAINEALFDLVGDTVIEYGPDGPALIEDYRQDVEGLLSHA